MKTAISGTKIGRFFWNGPPSENFWKRRVVVFVKTDQNGGFEYDVIHHIAQTL